MTHARRLVTFKDRPEILAAIDKELDGGWRGKAAQLTSDEFADLVDDTLRDTTRPMQGKRWVCELCRDVAIPTPSDEQRERLGIIDTGEDGEPCLVATNVKLWDEWWKAHVAKLVAKKKAQGEKAEATASAEKELSPEEQTRKDKERAEQYRQRLTAWREDWLRYLISEEMPRASTAQLLALTLLALREWDASNYQTRQRGDLEAAVALKRGTKSGKEPVVALLGKMPDHLVEEVVVDEVAADVLRDLFYEKERGPCPMVSGEDLDTVAEALGIDLEERWLAGQAGPLSEPYWELHTKDQLLALAKELKLDLAEQAAKKSTMVAAFLARIPQSEDKEVGLDLPKELHGAKKRKKS
jgi:hypothetical protein